MIDEVVGNYRVQITFDTTIVTPLSNRTKLKGRTELWQDAPQYVREFIQRKHRYSGVIYLLHFDRKLADHAQHYMGFTTNLESRLNRHNVGNGAAIMRAVHANGIEVTIARIWYGDRYLERKFKKQRNLKRFCPICRREEA